MVTAVCEDEKLVWEGKTNKWVKSESGLGKSNKCVRV
jgi:hypothetical protein